MEYRIPDHISGDTWDGVAVEILEDDGTPLSLAGASIVMGIKEYSSSTTPIHIWMTGDGVTITNDEAGKFEIDKRVIAWTPKTYRYYITITLANGDIFTPLEGNFTIQNK